jgi:hypothetical protein
VQALESFEVVRRLFEFVDPGAREQAAAVFTKHYRDNGIDFPQAVGDREYEQRMRAAYPFHPEVFDRLYQNWATMPEFQSTRGVLRLLAGVVQALWRDDDQSALILPGTIPYSATPVRDEVLRHLPSGFGAVLDADIEAPGGKAVLIDAENPRFGRANAARSLARSILLGSAPGNPNPGLEDVRVLLGAAVPVESVSAYRDALAAGRPRVPPQRREAVLVRASAESQSDGCGPYLAADGRRCAGRGDRAAEAGDGARGLCREARRTG